MLLYYKLNMNNLIKYGVFGFNFNNLEIFLYDLELFKL